MILEFFFFGIHHLFLVFSHPYFLVMNVFEWKLGVAIEPIDHCLTV